jgi:hypothetical protein
MSPRQELEIVIEFERRTPGKDDEVLEALGAEIPEDIYLDIILTD